MQKTDKYEVADYKRVKVQLHSGAKAWVYVSANSKTEPEEIRISVPQEHEDKFEQILFYILNKIGDKPNIDMAVLSKILYFINI